MKYSRSLQIPEVLIFEVLNFIHPCIHIIISKNKFCNFLEPDNDKLTISLLIALNNTTTFEEYYSVVLSYRFRDKLGLEVASKGNLSTLQWFQSRGINWDHNLLSILASRGELETLKWAISNKLTLKLQGELTEMSSILRQAVINGRENILKWVLESGIFDQKYIPDVVQSAAGADQMKIILWMIKNIPLTRKLIEKSKVCICPAAVYGNNIHILEWFQKTYPNSFYVEIKTIGTSCVSRAAADGNFRVLKWLKGNGFAFDCETMTAAAVSSLDNSLEILQYLRTFNCPWTDSVCVNTIIYGRFDILQWAVSNGCSWNPNDILFAAARSKKAAASPDILQWIAEQRFDLENLNFNIHAAIEFKNFRFVKWVKSNFLPNFWDDKIIKKAAAAGDLSALIWAVEMNPESIRSELVHILAINAAVGRHLNVLNWLLANFRSFKIAILDPHVCVLAAEKGFVDVLQWAVANGCNWSQCHCCKAALKYKRLKILIWMKFQAPLYSHFTSMYWYGESFMNIFGTDKCYCEGDILQWLILNFGKEEGVYFEKRTSFWRKIDNA